MDTQVTKLRTKLAYAVGDIGCNFIWTFVSGFLLLYYTDSVGISAAVVGTMFMITRVFDGFSDITMGIIIEKTHLRLGKARPWVLFFSLPLALSLVAVFHVPGQLDTGSQNAYMYASYLFLAVICYTAVNLSYNAMLPRFSLTSHDRNVVSAIKGIAVIVAAMVISVLTPILLEQFGGSTQQGAWDKIAMIYAALALILLLITFFGVKEKIPVMDAAGNIQKVPIKKALSLLLRNKYFYLATLLFLVFYAINGLGGITIYYARDIMGDEKLFGLMSAIQIVPMLIGIPVIPSLYKKYGKRNIMLIGALISAAGCGLQLLQPADLTLYLVFAVIRGLGSIIFSMSIFTLASDIVELDEKRYGMRTEGLVTSVNSVGMKVGTGLGSGMVGWLLAAGRYSAGNTTQPQTALSAMIWLQIAIPLILTLLLALFLLFWDIDSVIQKYNAKKEEKANV